MRVANRKTEKPLTRDWYGMKEEAFSKRRMQLDTIIYIWIFSIQEFLWYNSGLTLIQFWNDSIWGTESLKQRTVKRRRGIGWCVLFNTVTNIHHTTAQHLTKTSHHILWTHRHFWYQINSVSTINALIPRPASRVTEYKLYRWRKETRKMMIHANKPRHISRVKTVSGRTEIEIYSNVFNKDEWKLEIVGITEIEDYTVCIIW